MEIIEECDGYPPDGAIERDIEPVSVDDISSDCEDNLDHEKQSDGYPPDKATDMELVSLSGDDLSSSCDEDYLFSQLLSDDDGNGFEYDEEIDDASQEPRSSCSSSSS